MKILDFGLTKLLAPGDGAGIGVSALATLTVDTGVGTMIAPVGYVAGAGPWRNC